MESLGLVPVIAGSDRLLFPDDQARFARFRAPTKPQSSLGGSLDAISATRRDLAGLLDPKDTKRGAFVDSGTKPLGGLGDLPSHAILDRGRVVGLWEYDVETQSPPRPMSATSCKMRGPFSLDSPKRRAPRVAARWGAK